MPVTPSPTQGDDTLQGSASADSIDALGGNDQINPGSGADTIYGGSGNDQINGYPTTGGTASWGNSGPLLAYGQEGDDFIYGSGSADTLDGGAGQDSLFGNLGNDVLRGGDGNDVIQTGDGNDYLEAGSGNDFVNGSPGSSGVYSALAAPGNDTLHGEDGDDFVFGGAGDDSIAGGKGNDWLIGDTGNDNLDGGDGQDTLSGGADNDTLRGSIGNDSISSGTGNDLVYGGDGNDLIDGAPGSSGSYTTSGDDAPGNDSFFGEAGDDFIYGGLGNDSLSGGDGNDWLLGGDGNDTLDGGSGSNKLWGGSGNDSYVINSKASVIYEEASEGSADAATINVDFYKVPSTIENLTYGNGVKKLPYWISALIFDDACGTNYQSLAPFSSGSYQFNYLFPTTKPTYLTSLDDVDNLRLINTALQNDLVGQIQNTFTYISSLTNIGFTQLSSNSAVGAEAPATFAFFTNNQDGSAGYASAPSTSFKGNDVFLNNDFDLLQFSYITSDDKILRFEKASNTIYRDTTAYPLDTLANLQTAQSMLNAVVLKDEVGRSIQLNAAGFLTQSGNSYSWTLSGITVAGYLSGTTGPTPATPAIAGVTNAGLLTVIHELGHALGLKHPFTDPNGVGGTGTQPFLGAISRPTQNGSATYSGFENDSTYTVMSYKSNEAQWQLKFSDLDIAALQYLWGPSTSTRSGSNVYSISYNGSAYSVSSSDNYSSQSSFIWDGSGTDAIDASAVNGGNGVTIYLTPGYWGFVNSLRANSGDDGVSDAGSWNNQRITKLGQITVNFGTVIENLRGSSDNDSLFGNEIGNSIEGAAGDDSIEGWAGDDTLVGGPGNDTLIGGDGTDVAVFTNNFASYTITVGQSQLTMQSQSGETDVIKSVEVLRFLDGDRTVQSVVGTTAKGSTSNSGGGSAPICFAKGTRIQTADGEVTVDALIQNQEVESMNGAASVKWIGYQRRTPEFAQFDDYLPVKICAGALEENVPVRDLYLSPDHAVLVDGHLIHAQALVNGRTIIKMTEWEGDIEYHHIETENHEIIFAEGVPCETFIDNVSRQQFDNYAEYRALYPYTQMMRELPLPRVKFRRQMPSAIWRRLMERADLITAAQDQA